MPNGSQLKLTPGSIVIAAGALITLIFSFFDFFTAPLGGGVSAWSKGLVPVATLIVLFTVVMGVQVVLTQVLNLDLGPGIAGFTWPQVHLALGFFATLESLAYLAVSKGGGGVGIGLIFMLIGSAACFTGAILLGNEGAKA